jgi:hypothetical protein
LYPDTKISTLEQIEFENLENIKIEDIIPDISKENIKNLKLEREILGKYVVLVTSAGSKNRAIPIDIQKTIIDNIPEQYKIVRIGRSDDIIYDSNRVINMLGKLTITECMELINCSDAVICSSSSFFCYASIIEKPILNIVPTKKNPIYGFTDPKLRSHRYFFAFSRKDVHVFDFDTPFEEIKQTTNGFFNKVLNCCDIMITTQKYNIDSNGVLQQLEPEKMVYDKNYILSRYTSYANTEMAKLRMDVVNKFVSGGKFLEIGYGTGDVLREAYNRGYDVYGNDVHNSLLPSEAKWVNDIEDSGYEWDVVTAYDVIEHLPDLSVLKKIKTEFFVITVPYCPYLDDPTKFETWKHRRPNEHIYHFNDQSLIHTMLDFGYKCVYKSYIEDSIRVDPNLKPNILTCVFQKLTKVDNNFINLLKNKTVNIISHGGVGTNYLMRSFNSRIVQPPHSYHHMTYPLTKIPTLYLYGDFQNAIQSQMNRKILNYNSKIINTTNIKGIDIPNDPLGYKLQIYNMCDLSNVVLVNYNKLDNQVINEVCERLNSPNVFFQKRVRSCINSDTRYWQYKIDDNQFDAVIQGRSEQARQLQKTLLETI